jgi:hypothetical protein
VADDHENGARTTRRKFLRQVGLTAAAGAAAAGIVEVAGLAPAFGATRGTTSAGSAGNPTLVRAVTPSKLPASAAKKLQEIRSRQVQESTVHPDSAMFCYCTPGQCPGGACHPDGVWCHYCYNVSGFCGPSGYYCINGCGSGYFCP